MIAGATLHPVVIAAPAADAHFFGAERVDRQRRRAESALRLAAARAGVELGALEHDARGAPLASDGWHRSHSHTQDCAAAVLATGPVGIDVEPIALRRAAGFANVVSAAERALLGDLDALLFARVWTAKEALLKRAGVGLAELSGCRVRGLCGAYAVRLRYRGAEHVVHQSIAHGFVVSLASDLPLGAPIDWTWSV